ncbi:MAG: cobyric acid synthase, partial [Desulfobacula sp.]|nr:cobyric acid synthase [Desulfobacula sp.]
KEYYQSKGYIFGICGAYQMLGEFVDDPDGLEGSAGKTNALNLLPVQTTLKAPKTTTLSEFKWGDAKGKGYEIHMGYTTLSAGTSLLMVNSRNCTPCFDTDGCMSEDRRVAGTYMHGFFDSSQILSKWLKTIGLDINYPCDDMLSLKEKDYILLKKHFEAHIDMSIIV